jgi:three-Cys-motif partner protein
MSAQARPPLYHLYVDGFAGAGVHVSKSTGEFVPGSPTNALNIDPPFREYHLIDLDGKRVESLESIAASRSNVHVYHGDCNSILLTQVLPRGRYEDYRRVLCILDPYGLHLDWRVIAAAATMRSVEVFLNFPVADMNRNVLWHDRADVSPEQQMRLSRFWGDDSWKQVAYRRSPQTVLWGNPRDEKASNEEIAGAFRERLRGVAGFHHVPEPIAMRNTKGAIVYYLYFASQKPVAEQIVQQIFAKYRRHEGR